MSKILIFLFLSLTLSIPSFSAQRLAPSYSNELQKVIAGAYTTYGTDKIWIAGGTARALIQHVFSGSVFSFRDFDIVLDAHQQVTAENARKYGHFLERSGLGVFSEENLRPRPRFNPALSSEKANKHNAGYGFYIIDKEGIEFDISIFHSDKDMNLNGILDTDKLTIEIRAGDDLNELLKNKKKLLSRIQDPALAFNTIVNNGIPKVVHWEAVQADPLNISIRLVRSLAKFNALPLDEFTANRLQQILAADTKENSLQMSRNLLKLFEDESWQKEFAALVEIGLFKKYFKSFSAATNSSQFWKSKNTTERVLLLLESADKEDALQFLKVLADLEPELIHAVLPRIVQSKKLRVGYFTGEFAPFHKGHNGVVETALTQGGLDLVFVIPTPHATNDPKTEQFSREEWDERRAFVRAGLIKNSHAWLWPSITPDQTTVKLAETIETLESFLGLKQPLTHVFGMDSFHRVVARGLQKKSPRPRIAVTRPGVPIPEGSFGNNVRIIENIFSGPVSATRILHEIALTGNSNDLDPEVLKIARQTPRYQEIMKETQTAHTEAAGAIRKVDDWENKTFIWDPRHNFAGLYESEFPELTLTHKKVLDQLQNLGAKKVIVYIEEETSGRRSWEDEARKRKNILAVEIRQDYLHIKQDDRVMVLHSGVANELLKSGYFASRFRGQKGLVIYETADQPLSSILRSIPAIKVFSSSAAPLCRELFSAAGF